MEGPQAEKLQNLHSVLVLLVKRISELNKENNDLANAALETVGGAINSIRNTLQEKPTYERKGAMQANTATAGQLVSREA